MALKGRIKPRYKKQKAPKVVSFGTLSKPKKKAKWNPTIPAGDLPRRVKNPL